MQFAPTQVPQNEGRRRPKFCFWREMTLAAGSKSVFSPILGGFGAPNRFLAQSSAGLGLRIGFWCNPRRVLGFKTCFWCNSRRVLGFKTCFWCNSRRVWGSESVFSPILGGFWASNRFLAQSSPGLGLRIGFWCNPRRVLGPRVRGRRQRVA